MTAPITPLMWQIVAWRREQGRTDVRPVTHRPGSGRHMAGAS